MRVRRLGLPVTLALATMVSTGVFGTSSRPVQATDLVYRTNYPGCSTLTPPSLPGNFTVVGNQIKDPFGRPFVPRGVNLEGLQTYPKGYPEGLPYGSGTDGHPMTLADFQGMCRWGASIVRLQLADAYWLQSGACAATWNTDYIGHVEQIVGWITKLGMIALLDLHSGLPNGQPLTCSGVPDVLSLPDGNAGAFWSSVAGTFAGNPLVAFDLWNEPHAASAAVWQSAMQPLYDAVRGAGAQNLVFIEGNGGGSDLSVFLTAPVAGVNIVASPHNYPSDCNVLTAMNGVLANWSATAAVYPIVTGEFGSNCLTGGPQMAYMIAKMTQPLPAWGWIAFQWNLFECSLFDFNNCKPAVTDTATLESTCASQPATCAALSSAPNTCKDTVPTSCNYAYGLLGDYVAFTPSVVGQPVFAALQAAAATQTELGLAGQPG
jgi:endoglucanase